jgi:hypothetical protein
MGAMAEAASAAAIIIEVSERAMVIYLRSPYPVCDRFDPDIPAFDEDH